MIEANPELGGERERNGESGIKPDIEQHVLISQTGRPIRLSIGYVRSLAIKQKYCGRFSFFRSISVDEPFHGYMSPGHRRASAEE